LVNGVEIFFTGILYFDPEDIGSACLGNVGTLLSNLMA